MTDQTAIEPRIVRLSLEIDGKFEVFEGLDITAHGKKSANPQENTCEVKVSNLTKDRRDYILTTTSPFVGNRRSPKRMIVEAGRASTGVIRLFSGDITLSQISQPPDIGLTLRFNTGAHKKGVIVAKSGSPSQLLSEIAKSAAGDIGAKLVFEADDRHVSNHAFSGPALRQVDALADVGGVDAFVDDDVLVVKNKNAALKSHSRLLTKDTGMIGIPEFTERGLKVKALIDAALVLGGAMEIKSVLNPAANGTYTIYALDFEVSSRDVPFYFIAEGVRKGQIFRPKRGRAKR